VRRQSEGTTALWFEVILAADLPKKVASAGTEPLQVASETKNPTNDNDGAGAMVVIETESKSRF